MTDPDRRPEGVGVAHDPVVTGAIRRYEERLAKDPTSLAFAPLADAYRKAGRTKDAIRLCEEGLRRYPDYVMARVILAKAYLAEGYHDGAQVELAKVVDRAPNDTQSHRLLAEVAVKRGDLEAAIQHLERVVELDPLDRESRAILELFRGGEVPGDGSGIRRLLEDDTFVTLSFGTVCLRQGLVDEAATIFFRILKRDPGNAAARERLEEAIRVKRERRKG